MNKLECTCQECVDCCKTQPGWFAPGEAEKAAEFLSMSFEEFKEKYLVIDYWIGGACVYQPRKTNAEESGFHRVSYGSGFKKGECIFLKNDRCSIHEAKPIECRLTSCEDDKISRGKINKIWIKSGASLGME